jgi:hypothetical protein
MLPLFFISLSLSDRQVTTTNFSSFSFSFFFCYGKEWLLSFKLRLALAEMKATKEKKAERN